MLGPDGLGAAALRGFGVVRGVDLGPIVAARHGGAAVIVDAMLFAGDEGQRQPVAAAMLDADQFAAAEHRHEGAADRPLQSVGADPLDPLVERAVPGTGEIRRAPARGPAGRRCAARGRPSAPPAPPTRSATERTGTSSAAPPTSRCGGRVPAGRG